MVKVIYANCDGDEQMDPCRVDNASANAVVILVPR
jgi:hypothetical protein